ncbi:helix-turn-helix transcriptional regulator [Solirubrobacter sp. CPCC 204708]|nr:helix-turn-helix transcriptional regulator [Solirubrobacter deserti]
MIGRALRASLISHPAKPDSGRGVGMAIVDGDGFVQTATPEAYAWFQDIDTAYELPDPVHGAIVPSEVMVAAAEARARGVASRSRARTRSGVWLLIHANRLHSGDGTAVVIEPAKASEVAPLIVDAYELTPRELDVTRALARGLTTSEIARELHLSRYTVQDHLKAVYEKVGVGSRGELVAKVFADHYYDDLSASVHRAA